MYGKGDPCGAYDKDKREILSRRGVVRSAV